VVVDEAARLDVGMAAVRPLLAFSDTDFSRIVSGYTSMERYRVERWVDEVETSIRLTLEKLDAPYHKVFHSDDSELARYRSYLGQGFSIGAYDGERLVGLILAEPHAWNRSLWVWEFHVDPLFQRQGIGRQMMAAAAEKAQQAGFRVLVCETQSTNTAAIRVYRKLGFEIEGIDLSYYTNHDIPDGEVAIFMKRQLQGD